MRTLFVIVVAIIIAVPVVALSPTPVFSDEADGAVKVAIFPWKVNAAGDAAYIEKATCDMLSSRVGSSASIDLVKKSVVKEAVEEAGEMTEDEALRIGEELGADYVLYGAMSMLGDSVSLDGKLIKISDGGVTPFYSSGTGVDSLVRLTDEFASMAVVAITGGPGIESGAVGGADTGDILSNGDESGAGDDKWVSDFFMAKAAGSKKRAVWKSADIEGKGFFRAFVSVDLDGDGASEIVLISKKDVVIAVVEDGKLRVIKRFEGKGAVKYIALDVMKGPDGLPIVYLSRIKNGSANSRILEYRSKRYVITAEDIKWLVRVVDMGGDMGGEGPRLLGVKYSTLRGLGSRIRLLEREGGKVVDKGELKVPKNLDFYGFDFGELGGGAPAELVGLDDRNRVNVYVKDDSQWAGFWKGTEYHGGTLNILDFSPEELATDRGEFMPVNGRFILGDFDGDGLSDLIIKKNAAKGLMGDRADRPMSFDGGTIIAYRWEGEDELSVGEYTEVWRTRKVKGYISDFLIDDIDSDGAPELVMLIVEGVTGMMRQGRSYIVSFGLGGR